MKHKVFPFLLCFSLILMVPLNVLAWHDVLGRTVTTINNACKCVESITIISGIIAILFILLKKISKWWLGLLTAILIGSISVRGIVTFVVRPLEDHMPRYIGFIYLALLIFAWLLFLVSGAKLVKNRKERKNRKKQ